MRAWANDAILVQLLIGAMLATRSLHRIGDLELLLRLQLFVICAVEEGAEETAINGALVKHDRILLIVSRIARDGDNGVASCC